MPCRPTPLAPQAPDAHPGDFAPEVLCNGRFGAVLPADRLGSPDAWSNCCRVAGVPMIHAPTLVPPATDALVQPTAPRGTLLGGHQMDIECPTCGEPWDSYYMRKEAPHEWCGSAIELKAVLETGRFSGAAERTIEAAKACGWEFASDSVVSFLRCPCCKGRPALGDAPKRRQAVAALAGLAAGDEDLLASELAP